MEIWTRKYSPHQTVDFLSTKSGSWRFKFAERSWHSTYLTGIPEIKSAQLTRSVIFSCKWDSMKQNHIFEHHMSKLFFCALPSPVFLIFSCRNYLVQKLSPFNPVDLSELLNKRIGQWKGKINFSKRNRRNGHVDNCSCILEENKRTWTMDGAISCQFDELCDGFIFVLQMNDDSQFDVKQLRFSL